MACQAIPQAEESTNSLVLKDWSHTRQDTETFQLVWTIDQFSSRREANGQYFESSVFPAGVDAPKWILRAYPHGSEKRFNEYLSIYLIVYSGRKLSVRVNCSIMNDQNEKFITHRAKTFSVDREKSWPCPKFVQRDELLSSGASLLPQDKLTIVCDIIVVYTLDNISRQTLAVNVIAPLINLSDDLGTLRDSERLSDVKLIAGGYELKAHKAILSARSKVFAAMFQHPMKEKTSDSVDISDIDPEVLMAMLDFIYTGKASNLDTMVDKLLAASDKYEINSLKFMCEENLCANLAVENAVTTLILADRHNAKELKSETLNFIVGNAKAIVRSNGWNAMKTSPAALMAEAFCAVAEAQPEEEVPCKKCKK